MEKSLGCCHVSVKQRKSNLRSMRRSWIRCPLFVSERMFNRPKWVGVLSYFPVALANLARLASAVWSITWPVLRRGCRVEDQMFFNCLELSKWKLWWDLQWMYLRRGRQAMSGHRQDAVRGLSRWRQIRWSSAAGGVLSRVVGGVTGETRQERFR